MTLLRPRDGRLIGGVCAAVARSLGMDAVLVRGLWSATVLLGGLGLLAYLVCWIVIPEE